MVQGAHIKPDALGGSDRPENGIWLRRTEENTSSAETLYNSYLARPEVAEWT
jgi:hypothetical protein